VLLGQSRVNGLTTQQMVANLRSLVAEHRETKRQLAVERDNTAWLRSKLRDRPTRPAYEELAKKCAHLEAECERLRRMHQASAQRNRDLTRTLERISG
jgi:uncharacterized membrane protein YccC